jgi:leucyl-tRNA synthetase
MRVIPEKLRSSFEYYVDWMREKPCARKIGFGTTLPLDPDWIVEPLSDSTIYMAYYTIARSINEQNIEPSRLTNELFDYVFFGAGDLESVAASSGLDSSSIGSMREEFLGWYPNDIRFVGPDLVGNHATFFLFNHAAIFPVELWPSGIAVSGIVLNEGQKMSKSKGNSIPIADSLEEWGADIVRLWFAACAEFGQSINYEASLRNSVAKRLVWFGQKISELHAPGKASEPRLIDRWLTYRMNKRVGLVENYILNISLRKAIQELMFETYNDIQYYRRRTGGKVDAGVICDVLEKWVLLMTPFAPHFCEEMWEGMGREPFVVLQDWPAITPDEDGPGAEMAERLIQNVLEDVKSIIAATGSSYDKLNLYVAEGWKLNLNRLAAKAAIDGKQIKELISLAMREPEARKAGKGAVKFLQQIYPGLTRRSREDNELLAGTDLDEYDILSQAIDFISAETGMEIILQRADSPENDPQRKASRSLPMKPAIYLE